MVRKFSLILLLFLLSGCALESLRPSDGSFAVDVKKIVNPSRTSAVVQEIEGKISKVVKGTTTIQIKNVALEDFIRVVFSEALKYPYVMDLAVERLQKRIDVEIASSYSKKDLFTVVLSILEKSGLEVEDVEGVLVVTVRDPGQLGRSYNAGAGPDQSGGPVQGGLDRVSVPADTIYAYQPLYARAADIQKSLRELITSDQSKVVLHESTNSVIIKSSAKEKRSITRLLRILDERQKQVAIDVTVAEVSLIDDLSIGLEGFLKSSLVDVKASSVPNNGLGLTGTVFLSDWLKAIIQMGEKRGLISIKSNPYLLISDGMRSSISVGSEYPIMTSQKTATGETAVLTQIEYRKTGMILTLSPVVSGNDVHLNAVIEMSEGQRNEISSIDSPAILTRRIESSVNLESGQSLIIGGLISETENKKNIYFPGWKGRGLQTGKSNVTDRTELVIVLNVSILQEKCVDDWFNRIKEKFRYLNGG